MISVAAGTAVSLYLTILKLSTGADIGGRPLLVLGVLLIVVGLHPGTVRTALSRPFRPDAGTPGVFAPDECAARLLQVVSGLQAEDSGHTLAWDGQRIPP